MTEILAAFRENGLDPGELILDGAIHKFKIDAKDSKKSGWYIGYQNHTRKAGEIFYVVTYGNYKTSESWIYNSKNPTYTADDKKYLKEQIRKAKKNQADALKKRQEETANEVAKLWDSLELTGASEYLEKKQIASCQTLGIRFNGLGDFYVKMQDIEGKIWSLQRIKERPDSQGRNKLFQSGGRVEGCFGVLGNLETERCLYIAEGFATAASIHIAMGATVIAAFSAGNLRATATAIRSKYPTASIIICGDDDQWTKKQDGTSWNPGREAAEEIAKEIGAKAIFPVFSNNEGRPTDFNDLHTIEGIEEVTRQLATVPAVVESYDRTFIINSPYPDDEAESDTHRGTLANFAELIRRLNITIRYNVISKEEEILIPGLSFSIDNQANATFSCIIDWCERIKLPHGNIKGYITALADANPYNPVATWITSKSWDKEPRFNEFCETITAKREKSDLNIRFMKERLMLLWMTSAVAAAFQPNGVSAHGVLTLQGDQYVGKTKWFKNLVPASINALATGLSLKVDDKDSVFQAISKWIVELGELDGTLSRSDENRLKAWLTKDRDSLRRPFAAKESNYCRRTVFGGSVNAVNFLKDPTGNRRFWTIECEKINYDHGMDMQQVWAEVYENYYLKGHTWYLSLSELIGLNAHNEDFQEICPIEERIKDKFSWGKENESGYFIDFLSATDVCIKIGIKDPKSSDARKAGIALRKLIKSEIKKTKGIARFPVPKKLIEDGDAF